MSSCASSELGSELTILASSELMNSELKTSELQGRQNKGQGNNARGAGAAGYGGAQNRVGNANPCQNSKYFKDNMLLMQAQENGVALDEEQLLFIADLVYDEAGPSYDSDILPEVHDHDHYQDVACEHHEKHEMHDDDNAVPVIQSNVSSIPNDAYMMIFNDMHEPHAESVSDITRNTVVDNLLTAELATYKEQVGLYERRARFELTKREQKIDE
ncbi:hypothetical protein Tco_1096578 [Tanacetum coccineum]